MTYDDPLEGILYSKLLPHVPCPASPRVSRERPEGGTDNQDVPIISSPETASLRLLLHDVTKQIHLQEIQKRKYKKKLHTMWILLLLLSNLLSISVASFGMYLGLTTNMEGKAGIPEYDGNALHRPTVQQGHDGEIEEGTDGGELQVEIKSSTTKRSEDPEDLTHSFHIWEY